MDLYGDPDECASTADDRLLDRLGAAVVLLTPEEADDELVTLVLAWRCEIDRREIGDVAMITAA